MIGETKESSNSSFVGRLKYSFDIMTFLITSIEWDIDCGPVVGCAIEAPRDKSPMPYGENGRKAPTSTSCPEQVELFLIGVLSLLSDSGWPLCWVLIELNWLNYYSTDRVLILTWFIVLFIPIISLLISTRQFWTALNSMITKKNASIIPVSEVFIN